MAWVLTKSSSSGPVRESSRGWDKRRMSYGGDKGVSCKGVIEILMNTEEHEQRATSPCRGNTRKEPRNSSCHLSPSSPYNAPHPTVSPCLPLNPAVNFRCVRSQSIDFPLSFWALVSVKDREIHAIQSISAWIAIQNICQNTSLLEAWTGDCS